MEERLGVVVQGFPKRCLSRLPPEFRQSFFGFSRGMNFEFCSAEAFAKGQELMRSKDSVKDGIAHLLEARDLYRSVGPAEKGGGRGVNVSKLILRRFSSSAKPRVLAAKIAPV